MNESTPLRPPFDHEAVRTLLRRVVDPEVGANIVDLGLIYGIAEEGNTLRIEMTMTSPACPMGDMILDDMHRELEPALAPECEVDIRLVWEPPWEPSMMNERTKAHFGW
jgi:metal-sulfur cluster biosynthetic enzyme